jgi:LysR family hydrogen peroxide-inducible transcriptional activator
MQMVANDYNVTLLPEMAAAIEVHPSDHIRLLRFSAPEPKREIGLAWRKSSPRKSEFEQLGGLLHDAALSRRENDGATAQKGGPKR